MTLDDVHDEKNRQDDGIQQKPDSIAQTTVPLTPAEVDQGEPDDYGKRPACFRNTLQECLFVLTTTFAVGQSSFYGGAILCITERIGQDLNMTAAELTWAFAGLNLASGAFLLFFGRVADLFGRRMVLLASFVTYTIASLVMGFATNPIYLNVLSGITGLACAASVPPAIGKLGAVYRQPSWRKNRAFACFSAGYPVGYVLGAFVAGVATQVANWRATFWTISVIYACFSVAAYWTVPLDDEQHLGGFNMETLRKFDFLGALLAVTGVALFTASLTLAGSAPDGWRTSYVIAMLVVGLMLCGACIYWQSIAKYPLMPLAIWKDRNFTMLVVTLCTGNSSFSGNIFWTTLIWQRVEHTSPIMVAVRLLPSALFGIVINIIAGLIMHKVNNKLIMILATVALAGASGLWSATQEGISYWALSFPAQLLSVFGLDFQFTVTNMYVMSSLPSDQQSVAGGLFNTAVRLAGTVLLAVQTTVYSAEGGSAQGPGSLEYRPYQAAFWVSLGATAIGLALVPFLSIGTQGGRRRKGADPKEAI